LSNLTIYQPTIKEDTTIPIPLLDTHSIAWQNGMLVRSVNWLGDILITMPAVYALKTLLPDDCKLAIVCKTSLAPIWQATPWVSQVIPFSSKRVSFSIARQMRQFKAGVGVVMPNSFGAALDLFAKKIPVRIGRMGRGRKLLLTHRLPKWKKGEGQEKYHQVSHYFDFVTAFTNNKPTLKYPKLRVKNAEKICRKFAVLSKVPILAIAPGAAYGPAKQWSIDSYQKVAKYWHSENGRVVVVGTKADASAGEQIIAGLSGALNLAGKTNLNELMAILQGVHLVIANDSGAMHLAAALGTSGVAIFGSTDSIATGPLGADWLVLQKKCQCSPCFKRTCQLTENRYKCLNSVTADTACKGIDWMLQQ